jgi:membrane-bound lytic murein transglycosylase D
VDANGTIRVEAAETLGHYADWLDLRASQLRTLNNMRYGTVLQVGTRLRLDFSRVSAEQFEQRRLAHHQQLQSSYFTAHHITGSEVHTVRSGESVWVLSQQRYDLPLWLLRQYNPDVDFAALQPGTRLVIPRVSRLTSESST